MLYDCIVIGAGASGLFFAARAAGAPASVLLLERQNRAGRKLLLSGGGKCNVTNRHIGPENYFSRGSAPAALRRFLNPALTIWPAARMLEFLGEHGISLEEREHGQIFCARGAGELRDLLAGLAERGGAELRLGQNVQAVRYLPPGLAERGGAELRLGQNVQAVRYLPPGPNETAWRYAAPGAPAFRDPPDPAGRFEVISNGRSLFSRRLLLASGGPAWPRAGATSFGAALASAAGHAITPASPALTPLALPPDWPLHGLQGLSLPVRLSLAGASGPETPAFTLPLLFTHKGISGPACLQISTYLPERAAWAGTPPELELDFLPGRNLAELLDAPAHQRLNLGGLLRRLLPERLLAALLRGAGLDDQAGRKLAELPRAVRRQTVRAVQAHRCRPLPPSFAQAESSCGGVDLREVNPANLESRLTPGLHFSGELLDVCGWLGGYNLHWAWASANLAALAQV